MLEGLIIAGHNLNNIDADNIVLTGNTENKLQIIPEKLLKENMKKGITITGKKTEYIHFCAN